MHESLAVGKNSPGLMTIVRKGESIRSFKLKELNNILFISVDVFTDDGWRRLCIVNVYVPAIEKFKSGNVMVLCDEIKKIKEGSKFDDIIVFGDFNMTSRKLSDLFYLNGLQITISNNRIKGSRFKKDGTISRRRVDHIFRILYNDNHRNKASRNWSLSDHLVIIRKLDLSIKKREEKLVLDRSRLLNCPKIQSLFKKYINIRNINVDNVQEYMLKFLESKKLFAKRRSILSISPRSKLIKLFKKYNTLVRHVSLGKTNDLVELCLMRKEIKKEKNKHRRKKKALWAKKGMNHLLNNKPRQLWNWIRSKNKFGHDILSIPVLNSGGELLYDTFEKLNVWREHYKSISFDVVEEKIYNNVEVSKEEVELVTFEEIRWAVKSCANNKAAGPDKVPIEVFKILCDDKNEIDKVLILLRDEFNKLLVDKSFVKKWCSAEIVSLFKKGDNFDTNNYRGICLINAVLKIFLKIINDRITRIVESNGFISGLQAGFRQGEETICHVASVLELCKRREAKGKSTVLCFLDFEKAYDSVKHEILFEKLSKSGIPNYLINVVKNLYKETYMKVRVGDELTAEYRYLKGVRQGCPCSPMLFNIFINDIFDSVHGVDVPGIGVRVPGLLFADDVVLFADNLGDLKIKMKVIESWCLKNSMKINSSKCGIVTWNCSDLNATRDKVTLPTVFGRISEVDEYKYLGIHISKNLVESSIAQEAVRKGKLALGLLRSKLCNRDLNIFFKRMLIRNVLIPIMMYGKELWGFSTQRAGRLNSVVGKAVKLMFRANNLSCCAGLDEMGIDRIHVKAAKGRIRALYKWRSSKTVFSMLVDSIFRDRKTTWITRSFRWIKRFLHYDRDVFFVKNLKTMIKEMEVVFKERNSFLKSKGSLLRKKYNIETFNWKLVIDKVTDRELFYFLRLRMFSIAWTNMLVVNFGLDNVIKNRCMCCLDDVKEDIMHFLIDCTAFDTVRSNFCDMLSRYKLISRENKTLLIGLILGNKNVSMNMESYVSDLVRSIKFCRQMTLRRYMIINEYVREERSRGGGS